MYVRSNHNRRKIVRCGLFDIRAQVIAVDDQIEYNTSDVRRSNSRRCKKHFDFFVIAISSYETQTLRGKQ